MTNLVSDAYVLIRWCMHSACDNELSVATCAYATGLSFAYGRTVSQVVVTRKHERSSMCLYQHTDVASQTFLPCVTCCAASLWMDAFLVVTVDLESCSRSFDEFNLSCCTNVLESHDMLFIFQ